MKNVLIKFTKDTNSKDLEEIKRFLTQKSVSFCFEELNSKEQETLNADFCILFLDFEKEEDFMLAKDFVSNHETLKTYALLKNRSKSSLLNAHSLGCCACLNKISDLDTNLFCDENEGAIKENRDRKSTRLNSSHL